MPHLISHLEIYFHLRFSLIFIRLSQVTASFSRHAQERKEAAPAKAVQVADKLQEMKRCAAAKKLQDGIEGTLTYMDLSSQHWTRIRTNNTIERLNREIKRRAKAIGAFPDGQSALMLVCARLRHVAGTQWETRRYMNMTHLTQTEDELLSDITAG